MKQILRFSQTIFTVFALLCLSYVAWQSQDLLQTLLIKTKWSYLLISIICWILLHLFSIHLNKLQFSCLHVQLSYSTLFHIYVNRLPARYIPGGVWHTVSKLFDFHQLGIGKSQLGALFLLESMQSILMSLLIGGSLIFYFRGFGNLWGNMAGLAAFLSCIAILIVPWVWKYFKLPKLNKYRYFKVASQYFIIWTISSSAFISYLFAFPDFVPSSHILELAGNYIFSWSMGYLAIFAPQGIGVFEVVSGSLLDLSMPLADAAVVIAGFRVMVLFGDLTLWTVTKLISNYLMSEKQV